MVKCGKDQPFTRTLMGGGGHEMQVRDGRKKRIKVEVKGQKKKKKVVYQGKREIEERKENGKECS